MANVIATAFVDVRANVKNLQKDIENATRRVSRSTSGTSIGNNISKGISGGMQSGIRTGLSSVDRSIVLAAPYIGNAFGMKFTDSFRKVIRNRLASRLGQELSTGSNKMLNKMSIFSISKQIVANWIKRLGAIRGGIMGLGDVGSITAKAFSASWGIAIAKTTAGFAALSAFVGVKFIKMAAEAEMATLRLNAVLRATGKEIGITTKEAQELAKALQVKSGIFSETELKNAAAVLASFTNIRGDFFKEVLETATNTAQLFAGDLRQSVLQLGKALSDPANQLGALTRVGVTFTEEQKKQIKLLQEQGSVYEAQSKTLSIINAQTGDINAEVSRGLKGSFQLLKNEINETGEGLGETLAYALRLDSISRGLASQWRAFGDAVDRNEREMIGTTKVAEQFGSAIIGAEAAAEKTGKSVSKMAGELKSLRRTGFEQLNAIAQEFALRKVTPKTKADTGTGMTTIPKSMEAFQAAQAKLNQKILSERQQRVDEARTRKAFSWVLGVNLLAEAFGSKAAGTGFGRQQYLQTSPEYYRGEQMRLNRQFMESGLAPDNKSMRELINISKQQLSEQSKNNSIYTLY